MTEIRYVKLEDQEFWYRLDKHLPKQEFERKVREKRGYVLLSDRNPVGLLRYNLFWDNTPFCTMLYIDEGSRNKGYGKILMEYWEKDMKELGYDMLLTSTQVDEEAQHVEKEQDSVFESEWTGWMLISLAVASCFIPFCTIF